MGEKDEKGLIPTWDGKADTFSHFIIECKWPLQSSKASDRPLLAARIVRKALQSPHSSLVQLMYRLRPEDFRTEGDVAKLIKYLEESPLNKQPLPDAGAKIGNYYRRLQRRPHEAVNAFLIREEKTHDDMIRALQRLLREKELSFEGYDMSVEELKQFCGFRPGQSLYYGPDEMDPEGDTEHETEEERTETPRSSGKGRPFSTSKGSSGKGQPTSSKASTASQETEVRRGKDVLERLMEKGLMPLAALDVIRGWLVLETATSVEEERRLIKAATRNRLTYAEIRSALLGMFEEKHSGKGGTRPGFGIGQRAYYQHAEDYDYETDGVYDNEGVYYQENEGFYDPSGYSEDQSAYYYDEWSDWNETTYQAEEDPAWEHQDEEPDENLLRLQEEQLEAEKNKKEMDLMAAEADRNLIEARRAVAAAAKDRGWQGTVQQRQPRPTSTFPFNKSKGKSGKGKGKPAHMDQHWMKGGHKGNFSKGKSSKGRGKKGSGHTFHTLTLDAGEQDMWLAPISSSRSESTSASQSLVDTGATATAGGKAAVKDLCKALITARPDLKIDIHEDWPRYVHYGINLCSSCCWCSCFDWHERVDQYGSNH